MIDLHFPLSSHCLRTIPLLYFYLCTSDRISSYRSSVLFLLLDLTIYIISRTDTP